MNYELTEQAESDLDHLYWWLAAEFGEQHALRFEDALFAVFERIARFQKMGHERQDVLGSSYLFFYFRKNWILYIPGETLMIHRILPAVMDLRDLQR